MGCNMCGHLCTGLLIAELHHKAERRKSDKYSNMDPNMYLLVPVVIETSGVFGIQTLSFLKDLQCLLCS